MADAEDDDYADSMDEEDYLEIDSPMEPRPDMPDDEEELNDGQSLLGTSLTTTEGASSGTNQGATKASTSKAKTKTRVVREDRTKMLDYPRSLPYPCETLEEFDQRLAYIQQRLIECVETKE